MTQASLESGHELRAHRRVGRGGAVSVAGAKGVPPILTAPKAHSSGSGIPAAILLPGSDSDSLVSRGSRGPGTKGPALPGQPCERVGLGAYG